MLLMFSVVVPVLVSVTALLGPVPPTATLPHVRDVGDTVTVGPVLVGVMVRLRVVVAVRLLEVPVTVTVDVPVAAEAPAVSVRVLLVLVGLGLNAAVTPLGRPEAERVTLPLKPFCAVTVILLVPLLPCAMLKLLGVAESVKLGPEGPVNALIRPAPFGLPQPVARS